MRRDPDAVRAHARDGGATSREAIREVAETRPGVPIAAVFMTAEGPPAELALGPVRVPGYEFPEDAARAVALAAKRALALPPAPGEVVPEDAAGPCRGDHLRQLASGGDGSRRRVSRAARVLRPAAGLRPLAADPDAAGVLAAEIGSPVALKAQAAACAQDRRRGRAARADRRRGGAGSSARDGEVGRRRRPRGRRLLVQPMARSGVELIVGVVNDHNFGPVLACGAGGTTAELIRDVSVRITPLTTSTPPRCCAR